MMPMRFHRRQQIGKQKVSQHLTIWQRSEKQVFWEFLLLSQPLGLYSYNVKHESQCQEQTNQLPYCCPIVSHLQNLQKYLIPSEHLLRKNATLRCGTILPFKKLLTHNEIPKIQELIVEDSCWSFSLVFGEIKKRQQQQKKRKGLSRTRACSLSFLPRLPPKPCGRCFFPWPRYARFFQHSFLPMNRRRRRRRRRCRGSVCATVLGVLFPSLRTWLFVIVFFLYIPFGNGSIVSVYVLDPVEYLSPISFLGNKIRTIVTSYILSYLIY
jgi:hypothetical protein